MENYQLYYKIKIKAWAKSFKKVIDFDWARENSIKGTFGPDFKISIKKLSTIRFFLLFIDFQNKK